MEHKSFILCACLVIIFVWANDISAWPVETKKEYPNYYISENYNCGNLTCGGDGFYVIRFCDYFLYDCPPNQKSCQLTPECIDGNRISYSCANVDCFNAQCYLTRNCDKSSPNCKPQVNCNPFNDRRP